MSMPYKFLLSVLCLASTTVGGCSILGEQNGFVSIYGTHHQSPVDGEIPSTGSNARHFVNDKGWTITLSKAYVTTTAVQLVPCADDADASTQEDEERADAEWVDGGSAPSIDFHYGPCAENFIDTDDTKSIELGYNGKVPIGRYCTVNVVFAPYPEDESQHTDDWHALPADKKVFGNTVYVHGVARKGAENDGKEVTFDYTFDGEVVAAIDSSLVHGGTPLRVQGTAQRLPVTISKVYDRFFDGVDFSQSSYEKTLKKSIAIALEQYSFISEGTSPMVPQVEGDDDETSTQDDSNGDDDDDNDDDETSSDEETSDEETTTEEE